MAKHGDMHPPQILLRPRFHLLAIGVLVLGLGIGHSPRAFSEGPRKSVLLSVMEEQLQRNLKGLRAKANPAPYFVSYGVTEQQSVEIGSVYGALGYSRASHERVLEADVRVGDYEVDNSHGDNPFFGGGDSPEELPLDDDPKALISSFWRITDKKYKTASQALPQIKASMAVKISNEDKSADFSKEEPQQYVGPVVQLKVDAAAWEKRLRAMSAEFKGHPEILRSFAALDLSAVNHYFVNSEGTSIQFGATQGRLEIYAVTRAEDGMQLYRHLGYDTRDLARFPDDAAVLHDIDGIIKDLLALRQAPVLEPYTGPAILSGRAAGVFFHEILGHRLEGHRQKSDNEGQTFTKKVNQAILPDFISVVDDPTLSRLGDSDLNGYYQYDDEGVKAENVTVIDRGVLKNFLMSRSPAAGFNRSNGHGRKQPGYRAVGRQGNLIVRASQTVSKDRLRQLLLEECQKQGKPYGLYIEDISGGFTTTLRVGPQAYEVQPTMVYRVWADGRPDELVRGVDLVGTPLISFSKIVACGDTTEVFNGICGAESGSVPVSAVAPPLLTAQIETQKQKQATERLPVLPPPGQEKKP